VFRGVVGSGERRGYEIEEYIWDQIGGEVVGSDQRS